MRRISTAALAALVRCAPCSVTTAPSCASRSSGSRFSCSWIMRSVATRFFAPRVRCAPCIVTAARSCFTSTRRASTVRVATLTRCAPCSDATAPSRARRSCGSRPSCSWIIRSFVTRFFAARVRCAPCSVVAARSCVSSRVRCTLPCFFACRVRCAPVLAPPFATADVALIAGAAAALCDAEATEAADEDSSLASVLSTSAR